MDVRLSGREFQNPMITLHNIFTSNFLSEIRDTLSEVEQQLFDRSYIHQKGSIPFDNTKFLFEQVDKILQAAHLLYGMHVDSLVKHMDLIIR